MPFDGNGVIKTQIPANVPANAVIVAYRPHPSGNGFHQIDIDGRFKTVYLAWGSSIKPVEAGDFWATLEVEEDHHCGIPAVWMLHAPA